MLQMGILNHSTTENVAEDDVEVQEIVRFSLEHIVIIEHLMARRYMVG